MVLGGDRRRAQDQKAGDGDARREREREPVSQKRPLGRGALALQQAAQGDQGDQRGGDRQGLGARVHGAERESSQVDHDRRGQGRRHGEPVGSNPSGQADDESRRGDQRAEVEGGGRHCCVAGREAEVAGRPDPERLQRRNLVAQVPETAADRVAAKRSKVREVDQPPQLRGDQRDQRDEDRGGGDQSRIRRTPCIPPGRRPGVRGAVLGTGTPRPSDQRDRDVYGAGAKEPEQTREAVDVDGPGGEHRQGQRPADAGRAREQEGEGEHEQCLDRLLERSLGEIGGGQVRQRNDDRDEDAGKRANASQRLHDDQRGEHWGCERHPGEGLNQAGAEAFAQPGGDRVRAHRIPVADQARHLANPRVEPVRDQQVGGHVVVHQTHPEDPDAPVDDEWDRGDKQGEPCCDGGNRQVGPRRPPPRQDHCGNDDEHEQGDRDRGSAARQLDRDTARDHEAGKADRPGEPGERSPSA